MDLTAEYTLVELANGTRSIHSRTHDETFHPVIGPVAEAEALYVRQLALLDRVRTQPGEFIVWDVGLGAAANAITVLRAARQVPGRRRLISFDRTLEPLAFALRHVAALGYIAEYEPWLKTLLERDGNRVRFKDELQSVDWEVRVGDYPSLLDQASADRIPKPHVILYDAYSPATNPAMWTLPLFARLFQLLDPERPCALPTYSRSTMLRVTLLLAGFYVGRGHATGEKEETTIAANRLDMLAEPLDGAWLRRVHKSTSAEPLREAVYRQAAIAKNSWLALQQHPQFR